MDVMQKRYDDGRRYLTSRYPTTVFDKEAPRIVTSLMSPWITECYHKFYQQYHTEWDNSTAVLLEVGGGPCIYSLISAAPYVAEIYHSDYVERCRDEVLMWKNKDSKAYDWSAYFKQFVNTLEGNSDPNAVAEREARLRSVLKDAVPCDLKADVVVPSVAVPVNILSSNFCLDSSLDSIEQYRSTIKKIYDMVAHQGFFVSTSMLGTTWCDFSGKQYLRYSLSLDVIKHAYEKAGFKVLCLDEYEKPLGDRNIVNDTTGQGFVVAQKI